MGRVAGLSVRAGLELGLERSSPGFNRLLPFHFDVLIVVTASLAFSFIRLLNLGNMWTATFCPYCICESVKVRHKSSYRSHR